MKITKIDASCEVDLDVDCIEIEVASGTRFSIIETTNGIITIPIPPAPKASDEELKNGYN